MSFVKNLANEIIQKMHEMPNPETIPNAAIFKLEAEAAFRESHEYKDVVERILTALRTDMKCVLSNRYTRLTSIDFAGGFEKAMIFASDFKAKGFHVRVQNDNLSTRWCIFINLYNF